ncbi:phage portal protein [Clostridium perfringens]|uniref:phage portal protein n=3 Tax=Clostridium perfringens TaxID=1502 RepID=UPI000E4EF33C|nr:phage portal protein [Clostridium perfringens]KAF2784839.1 nucleoid-structuring protein H-NS [Clostridium perfringens]MDK0708110.1 phage portal protein [Clostridium perfringens]MDK0711030.1 phage portal protein [Clostridium perfringens]MDK0729153.1 phage portal protein [Clostridium perfringens]MDM0667913.1 phage portal protein [Clostridium perfringens]
MKFFEKLFNKRSNYDEEIGVDISDSNFWEKFGIKLKFLISGKRVLKENTVYICTKVRAESIGKLSLKIYKDREEYKEHELYYLLRYKPNPLMNSINFWKCLEAQRTLKGNAYAYIERDRKGKVIGLYPIDSDNVTKVMDDNNFLSSVTKVWYIVTDNMGVKHKLLPDEILHFIGDITLDGLIGIAPLEYLKCTIENGRATQEFINKFFKNGLTTKGIIQYIGDLDEKAKKTFIKEFESMSNGLANAHSVSLLPLGYQFQPLSLSMADAQFLENAKLTKRELAAAFGMKSYHLNDLERATFNNLTEQQKDFYITTLQPSLTNYEQEMQDKLLSQYETLNDVKIEFNVDTILRSDIKTRYEAYRIGIQSGFMASNEVRKKENLPPKEGGDELLINGNMLPIAMAGKQYLKGGENSGA